MDHELASRAMGALSQVHHLQAFRALVVAGKAALHLALVEIGRS